MTPGSPRDPVNNVEAVAAALAFDDDRGVVDVAVYAVVEAGEIVRVVVDDESVDGPLVSECAGCGRSDVAGDAGATTARGVAETDDWPGWEFGW